MEPTKKQRLGRRRLNKSRRNRTVQARRKNAQTVNEERAKIGKDEFLADDLDWNKQKIPWWERARKAVLRRDRNQCRICHASPTADRPLHIHHIVLWRWKGSSENRDNLAALCPGCHLEVDCALWRRFEGITWRYSKRQLRELCRETMLEVGLKIRARSMPTSNLS